MGLHEELAVCSRCGFANAFYQVDTDKPEVSVDCPRCGAGYSASPDETGGWTRTEYSGAGVLGYGADGGGFGWVSYEHAEDLEEFRASVAKEKPAVAFYTFLLDNVWYLYDLINQRQLLATEQSMEEICRAAEVKEAAPPEFAMDEADVKSVAGLEDL